MYIITKEQRQELIDRIELLETEKSVLQGAVQSMAQHVKDLRQRDGWSEYGMDYDVDRITKSFIDKATREKKEREEV
jgi:uncharacterized protein (UPF0335 family)